MATITIETTARPRRGSVWARLAVRPRELAAAWFHVMRDQDARMRQVRRAPGSGVDDFMRAGGAPRV